MDGTPFGRYRLIELLGRGGMGEVWRAFDTETHRVVALKLLPPHLASDPQFEQRFRREAFAAAGLADPHVVPIHNFGEIDGRLYVDMRLIEGRDLESILTDGPLEPDRAVWIIDQVASALHAAHRIGLVHRDVKPSNILVAEDDFAYLIDFGIARAIGETKLTGTGNVIGTWAYLAPERLTSGQVDPRADIYALTCVLHECLTGSQPFPSTSLEQQITAHVTLPPPRPSALLDTVPVALDAVIAKGMAKNPDERYSTTREMAKAARTALIGPMGRPADRPSFFQSDTQLSTVPTYGAPSPTDPTQNRSAVQAGPVDAYPRARKQRNRGLVAGAVGVVAILAVAGVIVLINRADKGASSSSAVTSAASAVNLNDGPFSGVFKAEFGPITAVDGTTPQGVVAPSTTMTFALRSVCRPTGCVATGVRRDSSSTDPMWTERLPDPAPLIFDDVDGRWVAVTTAQGKCQDQDVERWKMFSVQQRPDGSLSGEYIYFDAEGCNARRPVTLTRVGDVIAEDAVADPNSAPPRVASPATALWGRYRYTSSDPSLATQTEYNLAGLTSCLRTGERCLSFFTDATGARQVMVFANNKWTYNNVWEADCSSGAGKAHTVETGEFPLPEPLQNPITLLIGHGHHEHSGACSGSGDVELKFQRTGD